jgi:hypothetical protein
MPQTIDRSVAGNGKHIYGLSIPKGKHVKQDSFFSSEKASSSSQIIHRRFGKHFPNLSKGKHVNTKRQTCQNKISSSSASS